MTAKQKELIAEMNRLNVNYVDADGQGVAHLDGKTVNGNMLNSLCRTGIMKCGPGLPSTVTPGSFRWRYTLVDAAK